MKPQSRFPKGARKGHAAGQPPGDALAQAVAAINVGNLDEAERLARDVLARSPQHPDAVQLLGAVLLAQKRPREAIGPLEAAARASANPEVETHLAMALREIGRPAEGPQSGSACIERYPSLMPAPSRSWATCCARNACTPRRRPCSSAASTPRPRCASCR